MRAWDQTVLFFLNHLGAASSWREPTIRAVGTGVMFVLAAMVLYLVVRRPSGRRLLVSVLGSFVLAYAVGKLLNQVFARQRPFVVFPQEIHHIPLIVRPDSFPSMHAVAAFALAGGVLFGGYPAWGAAMVALGLPMIAARVAAGVHWPSDVLGGAVLGVGFAALFVWAQRQWERRLATTPTEEGGPADE